MKSQKKPEERKNNLPPAHPPGRCGSKQGRSPDSSIFHYSIVETHPIDYEYGSSPVQTAFALSVFAGLPIETDLTMKNPENYLKCAEKYSQSQVF